MTADTMSETTADRRRRLAEALRARRTAPAPLAPNQERLFALQQLDPQSTAYSETVVLRLRGSLDTAALVSAVQALPSRHEWLRSRIALGPDGPMQVVDDRLRAVVQRAEISDGGGRRLGPEAVAWVRSLAEDPLPLEDGPPWRAGLAVLGPEDHVLVLVVHHVACDATSLAVLLDELGTRYDAAVVGRPVDLVAPPSPRDIAPVVRALQTSAAARAAVAANAAALAGVDFEARIDSRGGSGPGEPAGLRVCVRRVPPGVAAQVGRIAAEHGVTPFAVVCVAVGLALADAVGVDTPVLGVPVDLRWHLDGSDDVVSFLVETVAVALPDVLGRPLAAAAAGVRDAIGTALAQPPAFDEVVAALRRTGELPPTGTPLHAYVNWLDGHEHTTLGSQGPDVTHVDLPLGPPKFDLSWTAVGRGSRDLELRLEYDGDRLDTAAAELLVDTVIRQLDVTTRNPGTPMGELELLSGTELTRIQEWEGTPGEVPQTDLFTLLQRAVPAGAALITERETVTGTDLLARVDALASALVAAGVGPGDRVAVSSSRSSAMVVCLLAVLRAGATFLPVDASHPPARQAELVRAAEVAAVVGGSGWARDLAGATGTRAVVTDAAGRPERPGAPVTEWPGRSPSDLAYVMFTSGSTGRPKAVRVPDSAVVARVASYRACLASERVTFLLQSTLAFDASIYLFWVLATGGCLVLPKDEQVSDPVALAGLMARHGVTDAFFVPGIYEAVLRVARPGSLSSCRRMYVGGDVVPPSVAALHHALLPDATFFNVYGPTEVVVTSTAFPVRPVDLAPGKPLPIGRPHPGTVAQVLDRHGRRVPVGAIGELHLGGPCVADGYDQEGAAQDDGPFDTRKDADGGLLRWYATGDLVRWRGDGQLDYVGRRDRQVKLRGQRVELGEIETAARGVSGVEAAAVELLGTGAGRRLVLFVAPQVQGVRTALADVLPAASLPDVVVAWPELPRLPSGKLDRAVLRSQSVLPAPHVTAGGGRREQHGSETELERTVLSIVRTLLEDDRIGPDDDFFAVGGNSLLAARLVGQMSSLLGVTVPLHELVGNSTSRGIATLADRDFSRGSAASREEARLIPVRESGELPPAVLVARDGATSLVLQHFLSRMDVRRPLWVLLRPMPPLGFRVPDLAADGVAIARMLEERFPDGPIHLVGHSASGMVAVETARALGERRGATVLLDAVPPSRWSSVPPLRAAVNLARLVVKRRRLRLAGIRPPVAGDLDVPSRTARSLRLYQDGLASARTRMRRVGFPLTVLASAVTREELGREDLGWDRWAADLRVVPVGGDHVSLLLQPEVVVTAREIEDTLSAWGQP